MCQPPQFVAWPSAPGVLLFGLEDICMPNLGRVSPKPGGFAGPGTCRPFWFVLLPLGGKAISLRVFQPRIAG